jgi:hypothetical protein
VRTSLRTRGFAIIDLELKQEQLTRLQGEVDELYMDGSFKETGQRALVRGDRTFWMTHDEATNRGGLPELQSLLAYMLQALPDDLEQATAMPDADSAGEEANFQMGRTLLAPVGGAMLSSYRGGAHYLSHRDGVPAAHRGITGLCWVVWQALWEPINSGSKSRISHMMGKIGSLTNDTVSSRAYTAICYLNSKTWDCEKEGGILRLFEGAHADDEEGGTSSTHVDVAPTGGKLVLFDSNEVLHCVFPTTSPR